MQETFVDANILVYSNVADCPEYIEACRAVGGLLDDPDGRLLLSVHVLNEFLHIVTDARRFAQPLSMLDGIGVVRAYLGRSNIRILPADELDLLNALTLIEQYRLGRGRISDALVAATMRRHGVRRIMTHNVRDFSVFPFLDVLDPLRSDGDAEGAES